MTRVWPGDPSPLGASFDGVGTRFAVVSSIAEAVELCLFDDDGEETRVELPERTGDVWHGELPDVGPGHPFATSIAWAAANGITEGYDDGTFRAGEPITRQAVAAFFHRFAGEPTPEPGGPTFSDVGPGHLFEDEITWLAASGITEGYPDGTFHPLEEVTRQAIAAFFHRYPAPTP